MGVAEDRSSRRYQSTWQWAAAFMAAACTRVLPRSTVRVYRPSVAVRTAEDHLPGRRDRLPDG